MLLAKTVIKNHKGPLSYTVKKRFEVPKNSIRARGGPPVYKVLTIQPRIAILKHKIH